LRQSRVPEKLTESGKPPAFAGGRIRSGRQWPGLERVAEIALALVAEPVSRLSDANVWISDQRSRHLRTGFSREFGKRRFPGCQATLHRADTRLRDFGGFFQIQRAVAGTGADQLTHRIGECRSRLLDATGASVPARIPSQAPRPVATRCRTADRGRPPASAVS